MIDLTTLEFLLFIVSGGATVILALVHIRFNKIDKEIEKLRSVRHDDRDLISEINSKNDILKFEIEDIENKVEERYERINWLLKECIRDYGKEFKNPAEKQSGGLV